MSQDNKCLDHSRVIGIVEDIGKIWDRLETKVSQKLFYVILGVVLAGGGFNWATYEKVGVLTAELKISNSKVDQHIKYDDERYKETVKIIDNRCSK